jgi:hypothetical protein
LTYTDEKPGARQAEHQPARGNALAIAYRAARVFDGASEKTREDAAVLVEDGRIVSVASDPDLPPGVEVVDLGDATLLPGLIDAHVHLGWSASAEPHEVVARGTWALTTLRCANNAALHLPRRRHHRPRRGATDGLSVDVVAFPNLGGRRSPGSGRRGVFARAGKRADLPAVAGDSANHILVLREVQLVGRDGSAIRGKH